MSISKEKIGIDEFTNAEDQELIEFTKNLSINEAKTETISLRVSKRTKWALEIIKRLYEDPSASDGKLVEKIIWKEIIRETNPFIDSKIGDREANFTKFLIKGIHEDGKGLDLAYSSVAELSFSEFYIFRIVKLYLIDKDLLLENEKMIIKFLEKYDSFWYESHISFDSGYLRPEALLRAFSGGSLGPDTLTDLIVKNKNIEKEEEILKILQKKSRSGAYPDEDRDISDRLQINRFDMDYYYKQQSTINDSNLLVDFAINHLPLEIKRLRSLLRKAKNANQVSDCLNLLKDEMKNK